MGPWPLGVVSKLKVLQRLSACRRGWFSVAAERLAQVADDAGYRLGGRPEIPVGRGPCWASAVPTFVRYGAIITPQTHSEEGHTMTWIIVVMTCAALAAWSLEWAQRHCEQWAYMRDKDL